MANPFGNPVQDESFEIDLTAELQAGMVPEGVYRGKCINVEKGVSKSSNNPMWTWTFVIIDGPHAGGEFKLFTAVTPAAMWKLAETLEAMGLAQNGQATKFGKADALNTIVDLVVEHDKYQDRPRASLVRIQAPPSGTGQKHVGGMIPNVTRTETPTTVNEDPQEQEEDTPLEDMSKKELQNLCNELDIEWERSDSVDDLITKIRAVRDGEEEEAPVEVNYDEMSKKELQELCKANSVQYSTADTKADLIAKIRDFNEQAY